jgi:hypothetical protein
MHILITAAIGFLADKNQTSSEYRIADLENWTGRGFDDAILSLLQYGGTFHECAFVEETFTPEA